MINWQKKSNKRRYQSIINRKILFSQGYDIYCQADNQTSNKIISIPHKFYNQYHILNRLIRQGIHNVLLLNDDKTILVIKHWILIIENGKIINKHRIPKGSRPTRCGICILPDKSIIYADYWSNPGCIPVNLYISKDLGESWQILWTSKENFARHIHFVCPVVNSSKYIYFGTGDYGAEPGIYKMNVDTKKIITIGKGTQKWRAVSVLQRDNKLIWGTDCEYDKNYIYSLGLDSNEIIKLAELPGPAYYSTIDKNDVMYIGTTIEDRKNHRACILKSINGKEWVIHKEFKKDIWHSKYFGYGIIEFVHGQENHEQLFYNLVGLKEIK